MKFGSKNGERDELKCFNKRLHWKILNRDNLELSDQAVNAVIRWFNGKGGKGNYGWLQGAGVI